MFRLESFCHTKPAQFIFNLIPALCAKKVLRLSIKLNMNIRPVDFVFKLIYLPYVRKRIKPKHAKKYVN